MSISTKAHIIYLNSQGYIDAISNLQYLGTVPTDNDRDNLGNVPIGSVITVSNSTEANNTPAIYHYNGTEWQMMGSEFIVDSVISILEDRYTGSEIDQLLLGLGIYPPVDTVGDLSLIDNPTEGFICNVKADANGEGSLYTFLNGSWVPYLYESMISDVQQLLIDVSNLSGISQQTKYWKAPVNTLTELQGLPSPIPGEVRIVNSGINSNPTLYRFTNKWEVYEAIPSVALESELANITLNSEVSNQIAFVEETKSLWWYSQSTTSWVQLGGDNTYSNATPTPTDVGGISAGTTFSNKTQKEMWDMLLYPYIGPEIKSFNATISGQENQGSQEWLENGTTVTSISVSFQAVPKSQPITKIEYFVGGILVDTDNPTLNTPTVINKVLSASYSSPNSSLVVSAKVYDSNGTSSIASDTFDFGNKLFYFTSNTELTVPASQLDDASLSSYLNSLGSSNYDFQRNRNRTEDSYSPNTEYIYYGWAQSFGDSIPPVKFIVNGLPNTAWEKRIFSYVNSEGYTVDYVLWRSQYLLNNSFNIKVQ